jgi:hypothetical protein
MYLLLYGSALRPHPSGHCDPPIKWDSKACCLKINLSRCRDQADELMGIIGKIVGCMLENKEKEWMFMRFC